VQEPHGAVVLGHGAGGGIAAPDLAAATRAARAAGWSAVLVEQPYRVAGRRSPAPAHHLDAAWTAVLGQLVARDLRDLPVVAGGRSSGARVACRTAALTDAAGVLCLAFPLLAPSGQSRLAELDGVQVPTLVVQGTSDRFGMPPEAPGRTVVQVPGDHGLRSSSAAVAEAVERWLVGLL
jgi:hypothetical protein